jgi:hypothetical protein
MSLFGWHRWKPLKWGTNLDARECEWCGKFQVAGYGRWHDAPRHDFPDARPVDDPGRIATEPQISGGWPLPRPETEQRGEER